MTFSVDVLKSTHSAKSVAASSHHLVWPEQKLMTYRESDSASKQLIPNELAKTNPSLIDRGTILKVLPDAS